MKNTEIKPSGVLAASITKAASRQTYYTIRLLVDRERIADAYRAYAYFRWVDDVLDSKTSSKAERVTFLYRQKYILESCFHDKANGKFLPEEQMLVDLLRNNPERKSGIYSYLFSMMAVMNFDVERRGRLVTKAEIDSYTKGLARAVTEAMHFFIGHDCQAPCDETRYLAVSAAHITHMLRDTIDDIQAGYYNIPREILEANQMAPGDVENQAYRNWVKSRVELARQSFATGRQYLDRVENWRCRLAGLAYIARFERLLDIIEKEDYLLRPTYPEAPVFITLFSSILSLITSFMRSDGKTRLPRIIPVQRDPLSEL